MKTAFVITCNDSVEHVVKGTQEQAETKRDELREAYFQRNRWSFGQTLEGQRQAFKQRCYWAARKTALTEFP